MDSTSTIAAPPSVPQAQTEQLVPWEQYQAARPQYFRTPAAFRWFKRQHEEALIKAGALAIIAGRVFVVPGAFDAAVLAIGLQLAAARAA